MIQCSHEGSVGPAGLGVVERRFVEKGRVVEAMCKLRG